MSDKKRVLHVNNRYNVPQQIHLSFRGPEWEITNLFADVPKQAEMVKKIKTFKDKSLDAIWCPYALSALHPNEIKLFVEHLFRVLKDDGIAHFVEHDIQKLGEYLVRGQLENKMYDDPKLGQIAPIDIIFGQRTKHTRENEDKTNYLFNVRSLTNHCISGGFKKIVARRDNLNIVASAAKFSGTPDNAVVTEIIEEDINEKIKIRDAIVKEPEMWEVKGSLFENV